MAHPCKYCDNDCYCDGQIDEYIASAKTPLNCCGCGCHEREEAIHDICDNCEHPSACEDYGCLKMQIENIKS